MLQLRRLALVGFVALVATLVACSEDLDSTAGCPLVCAQQPLPLRDTVLDAVTFDTSIVGYPPTGFESALLLANRPDTFETRVIVRFDTLPITAHQAGVTVDSTITHVDTATLVLPYLEADSLRQPTVNYTVEVYDVSSVADTATAALLPLFDAAHLVTSQEIVNDSLFHSLRDIRLPTSLVLARVLAHQPLRLGLRIVSTKSVDIRLKPTQNGAGPYLSMVVFGDSISPRTTVAAQSRFPADLAVEATALSDYMIVARAPPSIGAGVLRVGGFPSSRAYFKFDLPRAIVDSSIVVRATLLLTQRPAPLAPASDSALLIYPLPLLGSPTLVSDLGRLLEFAGTPGTVGLGVTSVVPRESGVKEFEIAPLVRQWLGTGATIPRVLILSASSDGFFPFLADFYSMEAAPGLRPRIRITYSPRASFGLP